MKPLLGLFYALLVAPSAVSGYQQEFQPADVPQERITTYPWSQPSQWWERHDEIIVRRNMGNIKLLFLGDSITHQWFAAGQHVWAENYKPLKAANFGIGSDTTQNLLWRITEGKELLGLSPKVVVINIGINNFNLSKHEPAEVAKGIEAIVKTVQEKLPRSHILLLGIFPSGEFGDDPLRQKIAEANKTISTLGTDSTVTFLDIGSVFVEPDGRISSTVMPDFLHLSADGYRLWADAMAPTLNRLKK